MNFALYITKRLVAAKRHNKVISAPIIKIGIISIALGIVVMLISVATGIGLQVKIKEKIAGFNGHIVLHKNTNNANLIEQIPISTSEKIYKELNNDPEINTIQGVAKKAGIIKTKQDFEGVILKGVPENFNWNFFNEYLVEGQLPKYSKDTLKNEILVSKSIANKLNLKLNDTINIWFIRNEANKPPQIRNFNISGIYNIGFPDIDNVYIIVDLKHIQKLNKWTDDQVGDFEIFVNNFEDIEKIGKRVYKNSPIHATSETIFEQNPMIFEWISLFDGNIFVIIAIMILISGFTIITALLVLIMEQTRLVGVLKALGSNNWQIRKIFLYQATYLVLRGLLWGNTIGFLFLFLQKYFQIIKLNPETYYVDAAPVYLDCTYFLLLNVSVVSIVYLMLILPSYFISKINPIKTIKFE